MFTSLYVNRRRGFSIWHRKRFEGDAEEQMPFISSLAASNTTTTTTTTTTTAKSRSCLGFTVRTPNSSRFARHVHSRILRKFPFLVEMFYWALNYLFYACTKAVALALAPPDISVVQVAQDHGVWVLHVEHDVPVVRRFFPVREADLQAFLLAHHPGVMTVCNRIYSLVHIPATVAFLAWYYYVAPNHASFAAVRRTMTLGNFCAFLTFCFWPCMPPRLLPRSFGFHDTVRQDHAESVWVGGRSVNQLAAMPSLHFTYAFCIGATLVWHSGLVQHAVALARGRRARTRVVASDVLLVAAGLCYPLLVLGVIVATANHYWMDATAAVVTTGLSFGCNRVLMLLLPLEDLLLWAWRLEKPEPTTGGRGASYLKQSNEH